MGLSTHCADDLAKASGEPVDYLSAGPVVATPTKPGREPAGEAYAALATARSTVPVFVTGGSHPPRCPPWPPPGSAGSSWSDG